VRPEYNKLICPYCQYESYTGCNNYPRCPECGLLLDRHSIAILEQMLIRRVAIHTLIWAMNLGACLSIILTIDVYSLTLLRPAGSSLLFVNYPNRWYFALVASCGLFLAYFAEVHEELQKHTAWRRVSLVLGFSLFLWRILDSVIQ